MKPPRFNVRDLFWLVLVCACLCTWCMEHRRNSLFEAAHKDSENRHNALVNELAAEGIGVNQSGDRVYLYQRSRVLGKKRLQTFDRNLARELSTLPELEISHRLPTD